MQKPEIPKLPLLKLLRPGRNALIIAIGYFAVTSTYILLSSWLAKAASYDVQQLARYEILKGLFFTITTSILLYLFTRYMFWVASLSAQRTIQARLLGLRDRLGKLIEVSPALGKEAELLAVRNEIGELSRELAPEEVPELDRSAHRAD